MKIAVLSDIHANLRALEAVLADVRQRGADRLLCLGDVVGYGPDPQACVDKLRELAMPTVRGNHDAWAARRTGLARLDTNALANPGVDRTRRELSDDAKRWLRSLPLVVETTGCTAVHASLHEPEAWIHIDSPDSARSSFARLHTSVGFFGHTHEPGLWREHDLGWMTPSPGRAFALERSARYLINPGSVGDPGPPPHPSDPCAHFLLWDRDRFSVTLFRVAYAARSGV